MKLSLAGLPGLSLVLLLPLTAAATPQAVFTPAPAASEQALAAVRTITSSPAGRDATVETVHFNPSLFHATSGERFTLALDGGYQVVTQAITVHPGGIASFAGRIEGLDARYSLVLTRAADGGVVGRIAVPGGMWTVAPGDAAVSLLVDYAYRPRPAGRDWLAPPVTRLRRLDNSGDSLGGTAAAAATSGPSVIDLLIAYSPGVARAHAGAALTAFLANLVDSANSAYRNSGIDLQLRLADSVEVGFGDGMTAKALLYCVSGQGQPSGCNTRDVRVVHALRAVYGADLVMMIADPAGGTGPGDTAGIAFEGGAGECGASPSCFQANYGYAAMLIGFRDASIFTHEIGHDLGAGHDIDAPDNGGAFAYSHGHLYGSSDGTVMAYADNQNLIFSSPAYTCDNSPCGSSALEDNALTLQQTRAVVAAYDERRPSGYVLAPAESGQTVTISVDDNAVAGPSARIELLDNGQPAQLLADAADLNAAGGVRVTLPPNLDPAANYALRFSPTYRTAAAFTVPLDPLYAAPSIMSFELGDVGATRADFRARVDPHGLDTQLLVSTVGGVTPGAVVLEALPGGGAGQRTLMLTGLACGRTYQAHLRATSAGGSSETSAAADISFTTLACGGAAPVIGAVAANSGSAHTASITAALTSGDGAARSSVVYGIQAWYGGLQSHIETLNASGAATFTLDDLHCATTYHFRIIAYNAGGDAASAPGNFTTAACRPGAFSVNGDEDVTPAAGSATYAVSRTGGTDGVASVDYRAVGGSAAANHEFLQTAGTLTFADGETSQTISVPILRSAIDQGDFDYTLRLSNPTGGATLSEPASMQTVIHYGGSGGKLIAHDGRISTSIGVSVSGHFSASGGSGVRTYRIATPPANGTATVSDPHAGTFLYIPTAGFKGEDSFSFEVVDESGQSSVANEIVAVEARQALDAPGDRPGQGGGGAFGLLALLFLGCTFLASSATAQQPRPQRVETLSTHQNRM